MLTVSDFQILIKSCSIESSPKSEVVHETKFSLKISYSTHVLFVKTSNASDFTHSNWITICYNSSPKQKIFDI